VHERDAGARALTKGEMAYRTGGVAHADGDGGMEKLGSECTTEWTLDLLGEAVLDRLFEGECERANVEDPSKPDVREEVEDAITGLTDRGVLVSQAGGANAFEGPASTGGVSLAGETAGAPACCPSWNDATG